MIGYVAKDRNKEFYLHLEKPQYDEIYGEWFSDSIMIKITGQFSNFDDMSCTDEPIKVEIKLERI